LHACEENVIVAHKFDRTSTDPYAEAAHHVEQNMVTGDAALAGDADSQVFDTVSNAVVTSLGDIAAVAFRLGITDRGQLRGLASAIGRTAETVLLSYQGEVDPQPAFEAIAQDPRLDDLPEEQQKRIMREIEKTRDLETLILDARRLPDLLDLAGQVGLYVPDELLDTGDALMGARHTPSDGAGSSPSSRP
jgi:hypothetical protein